MRKGQIYGLVLLAASAFVGTELQAQAAPGTLYIESNSAAGNTILKSGVRTESEDSSRW